MRENFKNTKTRKLFKQLATVLISDDFYQPLFPLRQIRTLRDRWSEILRKWLERYGATPALEIYDLEAILGRIGGEREGHSLGRALRGLFSSEARAMKIVLTSSGHIGKTRLGVREHDLVCLFLGCARPMVLRPVDGHYALIADVWVEGVMHGEMVDELKNGKFKLEEFELH